jgi:hypothetical protein
MKGVIVATKTVRAPETIPQDVKGFLIVLAICKGSLRQTSTAIQGLRDRIEAKMPGGSRLVTKPGLVVALIREHNERAAKLAGKAVQP